ncbi:hypothetical protein CH380_18215 [Leptospira adleri]|uniref:Uncharacterized protein n=1 Tax=Leptospira adleri TaxID=2023186 RepID=A0A2M9YJV1_9LEPT|nr:hypothetical protein CH380_18215 [Leptospira adleri]PJZ62315.1 hypothetical protein CH376_08920 [Leptospira adleri]
MPKFHFDFITTEESGTCITFIRFSSFDKIKQFSRNSDSIFLSPQRSVGKRFSVNEGKSPF